MKRVLVINGPNLDWLGMREPGVYGPDSLAQIKDYTTAKLGGRGVEAEWFQGNGEAELLQQLRRYPDYQGIVLNPGALGHSSFALYDCLRAVELPVVEVHLSNTHKREHFRSDRLSARACRGVIEGLGKDVYYLGILSLLAE